MITREDLIREFGLYFTVQVEQCNYGEIYSRVATNKTELRDLEVISTAILIAKQILTIN